MPISRKKAQLINCNVYFTGKICKYGHIDIRYVINGHCKTCLRNKSKIKSKIYYKNHKEQILKYTKKYYIKNKEIRKNKAKEYYINNLKKILNYHHNYQILNKDKRKIWSKKYREKRKQNPLIRLNNAMRSAITNSLKNQKKNGRHWEDFVDFTFEDLKQHLENLFKNGMDWKNYGNYWHVDHIKPISICASFKEAWQLSNLQPLEAYKNFRKGNRYIG